MSEFLGFGNAEAASDPEEFAQKILRVILEFETYRRQTKAARHFLLKQIQKAADFLQSL